MVIGSLGIIRRNKKVLEDTLIPFLTARGEDYSQMQGLMQERMNIYNKAIKPKVCVSQVKALLEGSRKRKAGC